MLTLFRLHLSANLAYCERFCKIYFDNLSQSVKIAQFYGFGEPNTTPGCSGTHGPASGVSAVGQGVAATGNCAESVGGKCQCAPLPFDAGGRGNTFWKGAS